MRKVYLTYRDRALQISQTVSAKSTATGRASVDGAGGNREAQTSTASFTLSWSHYVFLISIENPRLQFSHSLWENWRGVNWGSYYPLSCLEYPYSAECVRILAAEPSRGRRRRGRRSSWRV